MFCFMVSLTGQIGSLRREHIVETKARYTLHQSGPCGDSQSGQSHGKSLLVSLPIHFSLPRVSVRLLHSVADGLLTFHSAPTSCPIAMPRIPHEDEELPGALTDLAA